MAKTVMVKLDDKMAMAVLPASHQVGFDNLKRASMNAVPGEGRVDARVMLIGQNPGTEEDKMRRPFIGRVLFHS